MLLKRKYFIPFLLLLLSFPAMSQTEAAQPVKEVTATTNMLASTMIAIAIVLAFVIYALGQVLITLGRQVLQKSKESATVLPLILTAILLIAGNAAGAQEVIPEVVKTVPNYGGLSGGAFWTLAIVLFIEVVAILFILSYINRFKTELMPAKVKKPVQPLAWWKRMDKKLFTAAVPVEKEADIELDHVYDGIKELDNSLPPWWKWGFIVTVIASVIYMFNFHVLGSGKNPTEEYEAELAQAKIKMEAYAAKNKDKIDEANIQMPDATGIAAGRQIFEQACWACHGKMGEGGAGPNLTDDYWLHKGSLTDIYHSIKTGYPDKGMQAWQKQYSPKQISDLAGFIKSIRNSNPPNGKAPQGDLYSETAGDSTATAAAESISK